MKDGPEKPATEATERDGDVWAEVTACHAAEPTVLRRGSSFDSDLPGDGVCGVGSVV